MKRQSLRCTCTNSSLSYLTPLLGAYGADVIRGTPQWDESIFVSWLLEITYGRDSSWSEPNEYFQCRATSLLIFRVFYQSLTNTSIERCSHRMYCHQRAVTCLHRVFTSAIQKSIDGMNVIGQFSISDSEFNLEYGYCGATTFDSRLNFTS